jgi:D-amino-acid dehydrogenase
MNAGSTRHATIIGAGIVGVCSALWLQRGGWSVTVIDSKAPGNGASSGNAGNISPGSVVPYSIPGSLRQVPRWLFDPTGPLSIRPSYLPKLLPWLLGWVRASRLDEAMRISAAMHDLHSGSFDAYDVLTHGTPAAGMIEKTGQLNVSEGEGKANGSALAQEMRAAAGVSAIALNQDELRQMEPSLAPIFRSGLLLPDNGRCRNPHRLVTLLAEEAIRNGAEVVLDDVRGFSTDGRKIRGVLLAQTGERAVDHIVLAAGAVSGKLLRSVGCRVPLEAERGYHVTIADPGISLHRPVANRDRGFVAQPMEMGLRLAGTAEFAGLDAPPNWKRSQLLLEQAKAMFPGIRTEKHSFWAGNRPSMPDGLPILDRLPGFDNAVLAFGNSHFGMTAGPVMGQAVAALLSREAPALNITPFSIARFMRGTW